ncbi:MAG: hypothetical protein WDZ37_07505 [Solirubrobacterales bacterium]
MHFTDFLKTTVLLMAGEATALGAIAIVTAATSGETFVLVQALAFITLAGIAGALAGRRTKAGTGISTLLADARTESALPPIEPASILVNRLWPLAPYVLLFAGASFVYPQVTGIGAAFLIFQALAWRKQEKAVTAIEERDGARFYVVGGSPFRRIQLVRTVGMRRVTSLNGAP